MNKFIRWVNSIREYRREEKEWNTFYAGNLTYAKKRFYDKLFANICGTDEVVQADFDARFKRKHIKGIPGGKKS